MTRPTTDGLVGLALDGYDFISKRCDRLGRDVFETRLAGFPVVCMRGAAAGEIFYSDRFERAGVMPRRVRQTLLGEGGVQGLDGDDHHHRKALFLSFMDGGSIAGLRERAAEEWRSVTDRWAHVRRPVVLHDEAARVLCATVCDWAGVSVENHRLDDVTRMLRRLFESPARFGPEHWRGRVARRRADAWAAGLIEEVRAGTRAAPDGRALAAIAAHRDRHGRVLDARVAAVELINVLRPTVAVAHYVTFVGAALHAHPAWRERLRDDDTAVERFVQEVRRVSPFFPAAASRVRVPFEFGGVHFSAGRLVLFDLYGTNRDPHRWAEADRFDPDRFEDWDGNPFDFVPQGGGDHHDGHRCAGEWITIDQMQLAARVLTRDVVYAVPPQDLRVSHRRMPTGPASGFVIEDVRRHG